MNNRRELIPNIVLGIALLGVLIFAGAWLVQGGRTSVGGNIALGLTVVALVVYVFLRPAEMKDAVMSRQARYGGNTLLMTVTLIAIVVLVNFLSTKHFKRWDLTAEKQFTLAPETIEVLKGLQSPITILYFTTGGSAAGSDAGLLLDEYRARSDKIQVQVVDPDAQPTLARQYLAYSGMLVVLAGDKHVTVNSATEADITSALIKVTRTTQPVVYFTTGHGERDLEDGGDTGFAVLKAYLDRDGFQIKPLLLVVTNTVPSDASLVVIGGPHAPFQPAEVDTLRAYLARGGRLMAMVDSSMDTSGHKLGDAGLNGLLSDYGITLRDDMVIDVAQSLATDPRVLIAQQYGNSPVTAKLGNTITAFPIARSLVLAQPAPANVSLVPLVQTSDQSWGAVDLNTVATAMQTGRLPGPAAQDAKGPLVIAATVTNSQSGARLVVFGSSSMVINALSRQFGGNFDLVLNGVNWLAEQESQITIRPKPFETRQLIPSLGLMVQVFGVSVILMPLAVLVVGAMVWWRRR
jgi:ABC-type uncharacterized transport system involved in gliding motility auxiliary subunit